VLFLGNETGNTNQDIINHDVQRGMLEQRFDEGIKRKPKRKIAAAAAAAATSSIYKCKFNL
jgi:hypothetical protein